MLFAIALPNTGGSRAWGQPASAPSASPAVGPPGGQPMKVVVAAVTGLVQVRMGDDQAWQMAKTGMELTEGAEFRTGPRSSVTCQIPPDQTFTLDRLGTVKLQEAIRSGGKIKTDLLMKYGRTRYDIEAAAAEHESTIRSPSSTLAVRGTDVSLYDQPPFEPVASSYHGNAEFRGAQRQLRFGGTSFAQIRADQPSAADTALRSTVVDPRSSASRSPSDAALVASQTSRGATFGFDQVANIPVIQNGPPPSTDQELVKQLPGRLDFVLRWTGNADLNLVLTSEGGNPKQILGIPPFTGRPHVEFNELLFPGFGLNANSSGGRIAFDNRGGPNGGTEVAFWNTVPEGIYAFEAINKRGPAANLTLSAYIDGKPINVTSPALDASGNPITQEFPIPGGGTFTIPVNETTKDLNRTVKPKGFVIAESFVPDFTAGFETDPSGNPLTPPPVTAASAATASAGTASAPRQKGGARAQRRDAAAAAAVAAPSPARQRVAPAGGARAR